MRKTILLSSLTLMMAGCSPKTIHFQTTSSQNSFIAKKKEAFHFTFVKQYASPLIKGKKDKAIGIALYRDKLGDSYYDEGFYIDLREKPYKIVELFEDSGLIRKLPQIECIHKVTSTYQKSEFNFLFKKHEYLIDNGYPKIYIRWDPSEAGRIKYRHFTKGDVYVYILTKDSSPQEKQYFNKHYAKKIKEEYRKMKKQEQEKQAAMARYAQSFMSNFSSQLASALQSSPSPSSTSSSHASYKNTIECEINCYSDYTLSESAKKIKVTYHTNQSAWEIQHNLTNATATKICKDHGYVRTNGNGWDGHCYYK